MSDKVEFGSGLVGNSLTVYSNRVEIMTGYPPFRKKKVIPFSSISSVETHRILNQIIIKTNDGKEHKYSVGSASRIQEAINERM